MNHRSNRVRNRKTAGILSLLLLLLMTAGCYRKAGSDTDEDTDDTDTKTETDVNRDTETDTPSDTGSAGTGTGTEWTRRTGEPGFCEQYLRQLFEGPQYAPCDGVMTHCEEECYWCAYHYQICFPVGDGLPPCLDHEGCVELARCFQEHCFRLPPEERDECARGCGEDLDAEALEIFELVQKGVYCDMCRLSCHEEQGHRCALDVTCDGTPCYSECWGCAMNTACKDEVAACNANADCTGLDNCRNVNCVEPGLTGEAWVACENSCNAEWADGVALFNAYHTCIYCVGCPTSCAMDADDRCE